MSPAPHESRLRIGIDTGGTFTDVVCVDSRSGAMHVTKVASTPANPAIGLVRGVRQILEATGEPVAEVAGLAHGTTVATNALLQGPISGLGLVVTAGFRHLLEIGDARHHVEALPAAVALAPQRLAHDHRIEGRDERPHGQAVDRRRGDERQLAHAR